MISTGRNTRNERNELERTMATSMTQIWNVIKSREKMLPHFRWYLLMCAHTHSWQSLPSNTIVDILRPAKIAIKCVCLFTRILYSTRQNLELCNVIPCAVLHVSDNAKLILYEKKDSAWKWIVGNWISTCIIYLFMVEKNGLLTKLLFSHINMTFL